MTVALWLQSDLCQTFSYNLWNWLHQFFYGASHRVTSWKDNHSLPAWCQMHVSGQQPWSLGFLCCSALIDAIVVRDYLDMGLPEHHRRLWLISCSYSASVFYPDAALSAIDVGHEHCCLYNTYHNSIMKMYLSAVGIFTYNNLYF